MLRTNTRGCSAPARGCSGMLCTGSGMLHAVRAPPRGCSAPRRPGDASLVKSADASVGNGVGCLRRVRVRVGGARGRCGQPGNRTPPGAALIAGAAPPPPPPVNTAAPGLSLRPRPPPPIGQGRGGRSRSANGSPPRGVAGENGSAARPGTPVPPGTARYPARPATPRYPPARHGTPRYPPVTPHADAPDTAPTATRQLPAPRPEQHRTPGDSPYL